MCRDQYIDRLLNLYQYTLKVEPAIKNSNSEKMEQNPYCIFEFKQEIIHGVNFGNKSKTLMNAQVSVIL